MLAARLRDTSDLKRGLEWLGRHGFEVGLGAIVATGVSVRLLTIGADLGHTPIDVDEFRLATTVLGFFETGAVDHSTVESYPGVLIDLLPGLPHRLIIAGPSLEMRGRGDIATALRERAVERGVADRVIFTGQVPREKAYELLAAADVLAVPSHCEGMPKTAVEAAALGTPFVVTDTCGVAAELHGETLGRVVKNWDAAAFGAALTVASDLRPAQEEARVFVQRFSPERVAGAISSLLDAIG